MRLSLSLTAVLAMAASSLAATDAAPDADRPKLVARKAQLTCTEFEPPKGTVSNCVNTHVKNQEHEMDVDKKNPFVGQMSLDNCKSTNLVTVAGRAPTVSGFYYCDKFPGLDKCQRVRDVSHKYEAVNGGCFK